MSCSPAAGCSFFNHCQLCPWGATLSVCLLWSQYVAVSMRWCWMRRALSQQHSSADSQRSLTSACEGVGRGRCPFGERQCGLLSCMPGNALWRPAEERIITKMFHSWRHGVKKIQSVKPTLASLLATGLTGNWTSVAFNMVFSWRMSCWDWLWPKG